MFRTLKLYRGSRDLRTKEEDTYPPDIVVMEECPNDIPNLINRVRRPYTRSLSRTPRDNPTSLGVVLGEVQSLLTLRRLL